MRTTVNISVFHPPGIFVYSYSLIDEVKAIDLFLYDDVGNEMCFWHRFGPVCMLSHSMPQDRKNPPGK